MSARPARASVLGFGEFEFDLRSGELRHDHTNLGLQAKPAEALRLLLESHGELVPYREFQKHLWPDDEYGDFGERLKIAINKLRSALGDPAGTPRYIENLRGRGYRFIAPVIVVSSVAAEQHRLLVLPFANLSGDTGQQFFADGITEEMIAQLSRVDPEHLAVIARTSTMRYVGTTKSLADIGAEVGVDYILEGSIRRSGDRVRVTAQLIEVHGLTHVWAESFDRTTDDLLSVQCDVAEHTATSILRRISPDRSVTALHVDRRAYELYLHGRYSWNQRTESSLRRALVDFEQAIAIDPQFALPFVGIADTFGGLGFYCALPPREAFDRCKAAARKALELDPTLAEAHSSLAFALLQYDWDWPAAESHHREALALNPNLPASHHWYGLNLTQVGAFHRALAELEASERLDPLSVAIKAHKGRLFYFQCEFDRSRRLLEECISVDPGYAPAQFFLGWTLAVLGKSKLAGAALERTRALTSDHPAAIAALAVAADLAHKPQSARSWLKRLQTLADSRYVSPAFLGMAEFASHRVDDAVSSFAAAVKECNAWLLYLHFDPAFDRLRADRRGKQLLAKIPDFRSSKRPSRSAVAGRR